MYPLAEHGMKHRRGSHGPHGLQVKPVIEQEPVEQLCALRRCGHDDRREVHLSLEELRQHGAQRRRQQVAMLRARRHEPSLLRIEVVVPGSRRLRKETQGPRERHEKLVREPAQVFARVNRINRPFDRFGELIIGALRAQNAV